MKIEIYQVNMDRDQDRVCYLPYKDLERFQGSEQVNSEIYDKVFEGEVDCKRLEDVYWMFNQNHPRGYQGRSLSVSDIVKVSGSKQEKDGFYFCDSYGFCKVEFDPEKTQQDRTLVKNPPENKISVLLVKPGKRPRIVEIGNELEDMQEVVGGMIEEYMPFEDDVAIICNEEGKLCGLPLNRAIYGEDKEMIEIIAGDFFLAYAPIESEKFLSMPEDMAKKYQEKFKYPERFFRTNDGIVAIPYKPVRAEQER